MPYNFRPRCCPYAVDIWTAQPASISQRRWPQLISCLDPLERARAQSLRNPSDRQAHALAHALKRIALASMLKVSARDITFKHGANGKPALDMPTRRPLFFSLSHTRELVVCAVAEGVDVGIDAEPLRPNFANFEWLSGHVVRPEVSDYAAAFAGSAVRQFYFYWTVLEAYWKAKGLGLSSAHPALVIERAGHAYKVYEDRENSAASAASAISINAPSGMMISMVLDLPPERLLDAGLNVRHRTLDDVSCGADPERSHVLPEKVLIC